MAVVDVAVVAVFAFAAAAHEARAGIPLVKWLGPHMQAL